MAELCCDTGARSGGYDHDNNCRLYDPFVAGQHYQERQQLMESKNATEEDRLAIIRAKNTEWQSLHLTYDEIIATLRDQFAMAAPVLPMTVVLGEIEGTDAARVIRERAEFCYRWADAMMEARKPKAGASG